MKILHLSDIHMPLKEESVFSEKIIDTITRYIENGYDISPDIMLITGDFTNSAIMGEFDNAKREIWKIKNAFSSLRQCIFTPGNHDYQWYEGSIEVDKEKRHINYGYFLNSCIKENLCSLHSEKISPSLKKELDKYLISHTFLRCEDFNLLIIGMNSNVLESVERKGQGFFEKQHKVCKKLIVHYNKISDDKELLSIAAFHHHVLPVSSVERDTIKNPDKFSLTLDARRTLNFFIDNNVFMAVHGHQHQPSIVYWEDEMSSAKNGVYVVTAGTMTQNRKDIGDISKNSFMIYDIEKNNTSVYCFQDSNHDLDVMELSHDPYVLSKPISIEHTHCDVEVNANPPKGLEITDYSPDKDISNLYYLFLNVIDCDQARGVVLDYYEKHKQDYKSITICGLHNLYGRYDVLLKYRSSEGALFGQNLIKYLKEKNAVVKKATSYFMNVLYENRTFKPIENIALLKSPEAYMNSTWNMATLAVYLSDKLNC